MPTKIKPDFKPHKRVYELLAHRFGITEESAREFCGHQLGVFILHFETRDDAKAVKSNWNTAFYNWMLKAFEDQKEQVALHRELVPRQGNIFEEALGGVLTQAQHDYAVKRESQKQGNPSTAGETEYRHVAAATLNVESTETMSETDALEALAEFRRRTAAR